MTREPSDVTSGPSLPGLTVNWGDMADKLHEPPSVIITSESIAACYIIIINSAP